MSQEESPGRITPTSAFRHRSFRLLWYSDLASTVGSAMVYLVASIAVLRITGSALSMGLVLLASAAPTLLVGLVAGVVVDRVDRKRVLLLSHLARALVVAAIPLLLQVHILWLYALVALASGIRQFASPASESILPEVAHDDELVAANSWMGISSVAALTLGYSAAGMLATVASLEAVFYLDASLFLAAALIVLPMQVPRLPAHADSGLGAVARNLRDGFAQVFGHPMLRSLFVVAAMFAVFIGLFEALLLPFAVRALGATEMVYGLQSAGLAVGYVLGSLALTVLGERLREGQWIVLGMAGIGTVGILYAVNDSVALSMLLVTAVGFVNAPVNLARRVLVQRHAARERRGRVSSTLLVARNTLYLVGMASVGLADLIPVRSLTATVGAVMLGGGLVAAALPGLGQPRAEWRRAVRLLRGAAAAPGLQRTRPATPADFARLASHEPILARLDDPRVDHLAARTLVADAPTGTVILRRGEASDAAYFVLRGRVVAGWDEAGGYRPLESLGAGDFFGEIAALTGAARTANVVAEQDSRVLQVPAPLLREMASDPDIRALFHTRLEERVGRMALAEAPVLGMQGGRALSALRRDRPDRGGAA